MKKINLDEVKFIMAPNRKIAELASADVLGTQQVTCRVVDINPMDTAEEREPHRHLDMEEAIFVLEGEGRVFHDNTSDEIRKGDLILISKKERHMLVNATNERLRVICFFPMNRI